MNSRPNEKVNVTKTFLPPAEDYNAYLSKVWSNGQLTNQGPLVEEFEKKTKNYLHVSNFQFVTNGTIALQIALRSLDITEGEIITTPFSYVATVSSILWERCDPVFVDIEPDTLTINADKIEAAITDRTKAIMPVHVFGHPCDTDKIEAIAKEHDLKVIYDAAHAFGVEYNDKSLLDYGDISTCSFHATKLFHTIEGGCVIANAPEVNKRVDLIKRFGHNFDDHLMLGINAKPSEFQAAMGLCNLDHIESIIRKRKQISTQYDQLLNKRFSRPARRKNTKYNYSYYPVIFENEKELLKINEWLNEYNIFPRRYFYPSLNTLPYLSKKQECSVAENIATRIMCLPLYGELREDDVGRICEVINR